MLKFQMFSLACYQSESNPHLQSAAHIPPPPSPENLGLHLGYIHWLLLYAYLPFSQSKNSSKITI